MTELNLTTFPVFETERLILRQLDLNDAADVFELRGSEKAMHFIPRPRALKIEDAENHIKLLNENFLKKNNINWAVVLKETKKVIGIAGYPRIVFENFRGEIGYMFHPDTWNKGIATEALLPILTIGFGELGFNSIVGVVSPDNIASQKVLLKLGFQKEGLFREDFYLNGRFLDSEFYALLKRDFQAAD